VLCTLAPGIRPLASELVIGILARMDPRARPAIGFIRLLLPVWLVTAGWDFLCATALSMLAYHGTVAGLWRGVAATVLGPRALVGGWPTIALGLALHLAVALTWSALFVAVVWGSPALQRAIESRGGALAVAAVYGPCIWLVMSLVVIPLATSRSPTIGLRWWVQVVAHVPFVTIPLVFMTRHAVGGGHGFLAHPARIAA
jgi:hypothetical protein